MKKTLTALCFALCATLAFAQTNNVVVKNGSVKNAAPTKVKVEESQAALQGSYKGSIFTKVAGDTLASFDFATAPTTGFLGVTDIVGNDTVGNAAHTQSGDGATWHRITPGPLDQFESSYPVSCYVFGNWGWTTFGNPPTNTSGDNGFMFMAMWEQVASWGGTGVTGNYNAYFQLDNFSTQGAATVEMVMYQYYRCFNRDQCWVDYSTDNGTTWNTFEINVNGVDVSTNGSIRAWSRFYLPLACSNQDNLSVRLRYSSSSASGGAYGYFWIIDDLSFIEGPENSIRMVTNEYFEGFYHQIPQGLSLPLIWNAEFVNTGANDQHNVQGHIYYKENRNATAEELTSTDALASVSYRTDTNVTIDPTGWYYYNGWGYMENAVTTGNNTLSALPTENAGRHFFFSDLTSNEWEHMYKVTDTTAESGYRFEPADEAMYQVNPVVDNQAVWSRDNGMLTGDNYWLYGMVSENIFTSSMGDEFTGWYNSDYIVVTSFVTGNEVPEGWVIKGVEYVPATDPEAVAPNAVFSPVLIRDSAQLDGDNMSVSFNWVNTGAGNYETSEADLNDDVQYYATNQGGEEGTYNTIRISFPSQPTLQANKAYRLGYMIAEDGSKFACASANSRGFYDAQDEFQYFYNTEGLEDYGITASLENRYSNLVYDYTYGGTSGWHWLSWESYPMIRMIVGPYEQLPQSSITFTCENPGPVSMVYDEEGNELCGETISVPANASMSGYVADPRDSDDPEDKWFVDEIIINGTVEFKNDTTNNFEEFYLNGVSFSVETGAEGTQNEVIVKFINIPDLGINQAYYNTTMSLFPNPATSNVTLNIEGVEGMVELSLIDMSGRVIRTSKVNAEQAQVIDLNGLAKGAYFVRVTNSNMTKVEKLIVR